MEEKTDFMGLLILWFDHLEYSDFGLNGLLKIKSGIYLLAKLNF